MPLEWREAERGRSPLPWWTDCVSVSININMGQKESRGARYGVMSGLISQPCARLITQIPLGGRNRQTRRGEMKRPHGVQSLPFWLHIYLLFSRKMIRAHKPHLRFLITLLPFLDVPTFLRTCSQLLKCSEYDKSAWGGDHVDTNCEFLKRPQALLF